MNGTFIDVAKFSFTGALYAKVSGYITTKDSDKLLPRVAKITAGFIAQPVFALAMFAEAIVRGVLALIAKTIHLFIPKKYSGGFEKYILSPLGLGFGVSALWGTFAGMAPITNFMKDEQKESAQDTLMQKADNLHDFLSPAANFQFFN